MDMLTQVLEIINTGGIIAVLLIVWRLESKRSERMEIREDELMDKLLDKLLNQLNGHSENE